MDPTWLLIAGLVFLVAAIYSSVGHGGASGYLFVLSFFSFTTAEMSTTALLLNILVAGTAFTSYAAARYFRPRVLFAFLVTSTPMAFIGGLIHVPPITYALLLALALTASALRIAWSGPRSTTEEAETRPISLPIALATGGVVGLVSGIVGVGGGIFLSPILLIARWATLKQTAAVSAAFIVVNSVSGLAGRLASNQFVAGELLWLVPVAFLGGVIGAYSGAWKLGAVPLRWLLAFVLVIAAGKLIVTAL